MQSAFFVGYALTQVFGGVLGGRTSLSASKDATLAVIDNGSSNNSYSKYNTKYGDEESKLLNIESNQMTTQSTHKRQEGYRTVLPLSLVLTGITTFLFPMAAMAGPNWAVLDRFTLGLLEGVLLPSAMAGVSSTTTTTDIPPQLLFDSDTITNTRSTIYATLEMEPKTSTILGSNKDFIATASAIVIAGCYLGSAWAYLSAWIIFSEFSQVHLSQWGLLPQDAGSPSVWPLLFYVNGILSLIITAMFSSEFDLTGWRNRSRSNNNSRNKYDENDTELSRSTMRMMKDASDVSFETLSSKSGRAIIAAQIGQGALLYSIASWGPLYLERVVDVSTTAATTAAADVSSSSSIVVSSTAVAASIAASSLILPQITQALIGMSVGFGADKLSSKIGSRLTRRSLQFISGVVPALLLLYLSILATVSDSGNESILQSPAFLFGAAQTISALSLGAVSVSHLEVATPSKSGAVYALGNVFAAISGSLTVSLFGILLDQQEAAGATSTVASASNFALPFQIVAILSAVGSIYYSVSIQSELEIGIQEKNSRKSR